MPRGVTSTWDARIDMVERVMAAVADLHESNLVHLDIKPRNILVDRFGVPVLVDFGLARAPAGAPGTSSGGTPGYAAPEQFVPGAPPGPRADVHALGVLLFQAMTNDLPWEASSVSELLEAIQKTLPPPSRRSRSRRTLAVTAHHDGRA